MAATRLSVSCAQAALATDWQVINTEQQSRLVVAAIRAGVANEHASKKEDEETSNYDARSMSSAAQCARDQWDVMSLEELMREVGALGNGARVA